MSTHESARRSWEWADDDGLSGVKTCEQGLLWWHTPAEGQPGELSCEQTIADFLEHGPRVAAPSAILRELLDLVGGGRPFWLSFYDRVERAMDPFLPTPEEVSFEVAIAWALESLRSGSWSVAAHYAEIALTYQPDHPQALFALGVASAAQGELDTGEVLLRTVVEHQPDHYDAWYNLGVHHMIRQEHSHAVGCFRRALAIMPDNHAVFYQLGSALEALGLECDALSAYQEALRTSPGAPHQRGAHGMDFTEKVQLALERLLGHTR